MKDSIGNPIQHEYIGIRVDTRQKYYYIDAENYQTILFPGGTVIPIIYNDELPYIPVRRLTPYEIDCYLRLELTSRHEWYLFL